MDAVAGGVEVHVAAGVEPVIVEVLVVAQLGIDADHRGDADVGADVADALELDQKVRIGGVGVHVALARAHALEVVALEHGDQIRDHLHERLDPLGGVDVALAESLLRFVQDVDDRALEHGQLAEGGVGEDGVVPVQVLRVICDIHRMVAQTLKFRGHLEVLVHDRDVILILQMGQELDQVSADPVGHAVDLVFVLVERLMHVIVIALEELEGPLDVGSGRRENRKQEMVAALEGKRRRMEEDRVQLVRDGLVLALLDLLVLDEAQADFFQQRKRRQKDDGAGQVEGRVRIGDDAGVDGPVPEGIQQAETVDQRHADQDQDGFSKIIQDVDQADAAGVRLGADGADDGGGHAVAQVDAHDHGIDGVELQDARG